MVFREAASVIKLPDSFLGNFSCLGSHEEHTGSPPPENPCGELTGLNSTCQKEGAPATGGQTAAPSASAAPQGLDALLGGLLGSSAAKQPSSAAPPAATTKRP